MDSIPNNREPGRVLRAGQYFLIEFLFEKIISDPISEDGLKSSDEKRVFPWIGQRDIEPKSNVLIRMITFKEESRESPDDSHCTPEFAARLSNLAEKLPEY
jgi:hypothetical protein